MQKITVGMSHTHGQPVREMFSNPNWQKMKPQAARGTSMVVRAIHCADGNLQEADWKLYNLHAAVGRRFVIIYFPASISLATVNTRFKVALTHQGRRTRQRTLSISSFYPAGWQPDQQLVQGL
jgi:hypothetical protein